MKTRITSLLLVVAIVVSMLGAFTFCVAAADSESETGNKKYVKELVHLRYSFGDGYDDTGNIGGLLNAQQSSLTTKTENDTSYGYYDLKDSAKNVYFSVNAITNYSPSTSALGYLIYEMDINDFGQLLSTGRFVDIISGTSGSSEGRVFSQDVVNIGNDGTSNYIYAFDNTSNKIYLEKNTWNTIRIELAVLSTNATQYQCTVRLNNKELTGALNLGTPKLISSLRIGSTGKADQAFGIDNITLYSAPKLLNSYRDIAGLSSALIMKVGSDNALMYNQKIDISNAPIMINSDVYCPVDILTQYSGGMISDKYVVSINNVEYVKLSDVKAAFGKEITYDAMGIIIISSKADLVNRDSDLSLMVDLTKRFVYDLPSAESILNDVAAKTNFQHPYILADADRFATLRRIYNEGQANKLTNEEEIDLYGYIRTYLNSADSYYSRYGQNDSSGKYVKLKSVPTNTNYTNYDNNGYDIGGRISVPSDCLYNLAFAYQITNNLNYARLAYDYSLALGEWNHWGPDHFLNCADASKPYAVAYDWLYNAYEDLKKNGEVAPYNNAVYDHAKIAEILFTHGVLQGYVASTGGACMHPGIVNGSNYPLKTNNWNAVCTSGMVVAALALIGLDTSVEDIAIDIQTKGLKEGYITHYDTPISQVGEKPSIHDGMSTYSDYASKLISLNLQSLMQYGMDESYMLDGSYVESPSYWSYGTNALFFLTAALESATGTEYGFMDACGVDRTCYFALHSESSDYRMWNYHDGNSGRQDTSTFFYVGAHYGDDNLIKIRKLHLKNGKSVTVKDILFFDTSISGEPEMALDYHMEAIDGYTVRSSWDKGAIYAGIIGGSNSVSHGQIDAGAFVYHNGGKIWFCDLGVDQYNYSGGYFNNYALYRKNSEGHNVICLTDEEDVRYGQALSSVSPIVKTGSDGDNGSYSIINTTAAYGGHAISAKRGMLFTNSRTTTVIQDEITFNAPKTVYWFGHYSLDEVDDVILSGDGRTAYMISDGMMLRASIVSGNEELTFEIMDAYTYVLGSTIRTDITTMDGPKTEYNRDNIRKLAIKCENVESLNLAVVIEPVNSYVVGANYEWTDMTSWDPTAIESTAINTNINIDYDNQSSQIGSTSIDSVDGIYELTIENGENKYATLYSSINAKANVNTVFSPLTTNGASISLGKQTEYIAFDLDLRATKAFPDGLKLIAEVQNAVGSVENVEILTFNGDKIEFGDSEIATNCQWRHLTLIYSNADNALYIYYNGKLFGKAHDVLSTIALKLNAIKFTIKGYVNCTFENSLSIDNIVLRSFGTLYDGNIASVLSTGSDLSAWTDSLYSDESVPEIAPLAKVGEEKIYTYTELEAAISEGKTVSLEKNCLQTINITGAGTIIKNGYDFNYSSEKYIAHIDGDTISFNSNSVTVTWHVGNKVYTEKYSSSSVATFKIPIPELNSITEKTRVNADGTIRYDYYTTSWAASPSGKSLSAKDMVVTSENCEFWLVYNAPVSCLYMLKDSDGNVKMGGNLSSLVAAIESSDPEYDNIILCSNVDLSSRSRIKLSVNEKHIYLNGYKITHSSDDHLFWFTNKSKENTHFHGPGTIEKTGEKSGTILITDAYTTDKTVNAGVVFENVSLSGTFEVFDVRVGQHKFINCTLIQNNTGYTSSLCIWNKNTESERDNIVTVTLDGCKITRRSPKSSNVFNIIGYAEFIVKDCEVINPDGILYNTDHTNAKLTISGDTLISTKSIMTSEKVSTGVAISLGVKFTSIPESVTYDSSKYVIAKCDDLKYPYIICEGKATIYWFDLNGKAIANEDFALGYTPAVTNTAVLEYLKNLNAETGLNYGYNTVEIPLNHPTRQPIRYDVALLEKKSDLQMNLTLDTTFDVNIYIPEGYATSVTLRGKAFDVSGLATEMIDDKSYYRFTVKNITPANAATDINVVFTDASGNESSITVSIVQYLNDLLGSIQSKETNTMIANMLKYISAAYTYAGKDSTDEYSTITTLFKEYSTKLGIFSAPESQRVDMSAVTDAIESASLNIISNPVIAFKLSNDYTGKITIEFNGSTYEFDVVYGVVSGNNYIFLPLPINSLDGDINITTASGTSTYSFNAYRTAVSSADAKLSDLMFWLYNYSKAAKLYSDASN